MVYRNSYQIDNKLVYVKNISNIWRRKQQDANIVYSRDGDGRIKSGTGSSRLKALHKKKCKFRLYFNNEDEEKKPFQYRLSTKTWLVRIVKWRRMPFVQYTCIASCEGFIK